MSKGYIPEKVTFFAQAKQTLPVYGKTHTVTPSFPLADRTVAKDGKTLKNAKAWVLGNWRFHRSMDISQVKGVEADNTPKDGYRIIDAEQRLRVRGDVTPPTDWTGEITRINRGGGQPVDAAAHLLYRNAAQREQDLQWGHVTGPVAKVTTNFNPEDVVWPD